ncbi:MAG: helicase C-terminal domain-containing protein [Ignisphaera sp.]
MTTAVMPHVSGDDSEQNHLLDYVYDELRKGNSLAIEAYPGFGKTRLGSRLLTIFERIVMAVRTHHEMAEVFSFIGRTRGVAYAYGKPKLCHRVNNFSYGFCRAMLLFGSCNTKITNNDVAWVAATFRRPEDIREEARKRGRCLYFAVKVLAQNAKRIVATYDYLVSNPELLIGREAVILDEAHTLLNYIDEAVISLNKTTIETLIGSLKLNNDTKWLFYAVRSAYKRSTNIHEFVENLSLAYSNYKGPDTEAIRIIDAVLDAYSHGRYVSDGKTYYFLSNALPRVMKFEPKLVLGAYLLPMFTNSIKNIIRVPGEPRVRLAVDTDLTSRYEDRGEDTYTGYARKLSQYVRNDTGNLAVFPSTDFMLEVLKRLSIVDRVVTEPVNQEVKPGYVLVDVAGGRYTEGLNIKGIGNVIVCGMPYPEPNPLLDLIAKTYNCDLYTYIAIMRTVQAIGRIRGRGTAYTIDKRFAHHLDKLPRWIDLTSSPP